MNMSAILIKRIYTPAEKSDGFRVLVDRLWPRGVTKEAAHLDLWLKEIAPSTELRQWFHAGEASNRWEEFKAKYLAELNQNNAVDTLKNIIGKNETITLLYSVNSQNYNHALILRDFVKG
jgi:uncharacterized protein YeaO (DUF488 family)